MCIVCECVVLLDSKNTHIRGKLLHRNRLEKLNKFSAAHPDVSNEGVQQESCCNALNSTPGSVKVAGGWVIEGVWRKRIPSEAAKSSTIVEECVQLRRSAYSKLIAGIEDGAVPECRTLCSELSA